ncbi:MAG: peptidyl-prolyl cis-trans isomerase [Thermodesulfovibrionales bacterium]|nr:peptidyl-prolyl cis-trans isomerase [Thermodesulfovibrionales bacterium]
MLAVVDGTPITEEDLTYALTIAHRREDLSSAGTLDIRQYVDKLVDDRLIMNEARTAGIDQYPDVRQAVEAYILRESVVKLHSEEIVRKVSVTAQEFEEFYRKNYERFVLGIIETDSEEKAQTILNELEHESDFAESAKKYSTHPSQQKGAETILEYQSMSPLLRDAVSVLKPGETSDAIKIGDKYYIARLVRREEAPIQECERARKRIEKALREQKEKKRSDEYLAYLRGKANVTINHELLAEVNLNGSEEERKKWLEDRTPLVTMNETVLTVSDFFSSVPLKNRKSKEQLVESWIERKLVDQEALSRHYENDPDMKRSIRRYEDQLLKDIFIKRIIFPQIKITEQTLKDYYSQHKDDFRKPVCYKIQQITVKNREEAEEIVKSLSGGADFSWLAKRKSVGPYADKGGDAGCQTKKELPEQARDLLGTLRTGEASPVVQLDQMYRVFMIRGQEGGMVEELEKVKEAVTRACFSEQLDTLMEKYVNQLKADARIHIYSDEISAFEKKVKT